MNNQYILKKENKGKGYILSCSNDDIFLNILPRKHVSRKKMKDIILKEFNNVDLYNTLSWEIEDVLIDKYNFIKL